ncbi:MAG: cheC-like family protein [Magnetococcales bacterium]|nr:cheC-like family protein [Magnetococcales bacterium]
MLNELEEDAIKEIFNLSLGHAIPTLSEMVDAEIEFFPPGIEMTPANHLANTIEKLMGSAVCLVHMGFDLVFTEKANITGTAILLLRSGVVEPLLDALYGEHVPETMQNHVCQETFTDVGDLLLYTCVSTLSRLLDSGLEGRKPVFFRGNPMDWNIGPALCLAPEDVPHGEEIPKETLFINLRIDLAIPAKKVAGSVLIWLNTCDKTDIKMAIQRFIADRID